MLSIVDFTLKIWSLIFSRFQIPIKNNGKVSLEHEAKVSKISEEQLYFLMSRGLSESQATEMIVMGFVEPFTKELPMEYAVELNRLIAYEMEGSVG